MAKIQIPTLTYGGHRISGTAVPSANDAILQPCAVRARRRGMNLYGEIVNVNLVRDKKTGKQKGFVFICYEDQRSTILAVDNLNGIKIKGRTLRVDHVSNYRPPKDTEATDAVTNALHELGCGPPVIQASRSSVHNILQNPQSSDSLASTSKESKKEKKKLKKEKHKKEKKEKKNKKMKEEEETDRMNKRSGQISMNVEERCTVWQPVEMKNEKVDPDHSQHLGRKELGREGEERRFQEEERIKMEMDRGSGKNSRAICRKDFTERARDTEGRKGRENSRGENSRGKGGIREEVWESYRSKERVKEKFTRRMEDLREREFSRSRERRTHVERDEKRVWNRDQGTEQALKMFRYSDEHYQRDVGRDVTREKHREVEKTHIWVREKEKVSRRE
uniref:RNA-binding motif protein, X-linked 2-like n=1 Tax=Myxine glutinosa TaxID=7769 RepID=UPI00359010F0